MAKTPIGNVKGVGIEKIEFTSSTGGELPGIAGATDTYTITYTDGTDDTFEVYNGKDGADASAVIPLLIPATDWGSDLNNVPDYMGLSKTAHLTAQGTAVANAPLADSTWFDVVTTTFSTAGYATQTAYAMNNNDRIFRRSLNGGTWGAWMEVPRILDNTISTTTGWSSSKIDAAKVSATKNITMTKIGFTQGDTINIVDFLSALVKTYGTHGYGDVRWENSEAAYVTDGTTTVHIIGGILSFSASSVDFPDSIWTYVEAIYCPMESHLSNIYKFVARVGATAGTVEVAKIYTYSGQTAADVARTALNYNTTYATVTTNGHATSNSYIVKNGICYVSLDFTTTADVPSGVFGLASGLPAAAQITPQTATPYNTSAFAKTGVVFVDGTSLNCAGIIPNVRYSLSFSYPVAST